MPSTHRWFRGGPGLSRAGRNALFAADDTQVWVWDEETGNPVTDLLDETATPISAPKVVDGWVLGAGLPNAVRVASFSLGKDGKRYPLEPANAAVLAQDAQAAAASSATAAQSSADSSAASAALVGAPAGDAIDAHVGPSLVSGGSGDATTSLNAFLSAASPLGVKKLIGTFTVSGTLTFPGKNLDLTAATINHTVTGATVLAVTGDNAVVAGGTFNGPSSWDGTNSEWLYSVVHCTGAKPTVRNVTLNNVQRVGIGFKNATGTCRALDNTIVGNYPAASWTEVETMHAGIGFDPGAKAKLVARGNAVSSCVQGMFLGNYGAGSSVGSIVNGNTFDGCHNHAVYGSSGVTDTRITSNTMTDCSRPIAVTGRGHDVSHNSMTTTLASGNLSEACGIQCRDAVDCTVSFNTAVGNLHSTTPAIDLVRTSTNTVLTGNRVIGNRVEVTGSNTGIGIRVGSGNETTCFGNIVEGNDVKGPGTANLGLITFSGANGSQGYGNKCINNRVTITGNTHGIYVAEQRGLDVKGNHVRLEYSSGSAITLGAVFVTANSTGTKVRHNDFEVPSTFGTNVTFRAYYEAASTVVASRVGPNRYSLDPTLATVAAHFIQGTSGTVLTEVGMTGAPTTACGPGSTWTRADGGTGTTFYVKESAASSGTWRAV
jgi:hypothetical protein